MIARHETTALTRQPSRSNTRAFDRAEAIGNRLCRRRLATELIAFAVLAAMTAASAVWVKQLAVSPPPLMQRAQHATAAAPTPAVVLKAAGVNDQDFTIESVEITNPADLSIRWFDGKPMRPARTIWMTVTAYSPDAASCAPFDDGITASLKSVFTNGMRLVAADPRVLPIGSLISVPGYASGEIVPVLDKGGAIKGNRLDVLYPTHKRARQWGRQKLAVTVWEPVRD
jgi:3D (Asp-Asp-Asp) domain-containing protein